MLGEGVRGRLLMGREERAVDRRAVQGEWRAGCSFGREMRMKLR